MRCGDLNWIRVVQDKYEYVDGLKGHGSECLVSIKHGYLSPGE
jgi:hypothetical protein